MKQRKCIENNKLHLFMLNHGRAAWMMVFLYLDVCNEVLLLHNQSVELVLQGRHSLDDASETWRRHMLKICVGHRTQDTELATDLAPKPIKAGQTYITGN